MRGRNGKEHGSVTCFHAENFVGVGVSICPHAIVMGPRQATICRYVVAHAIEWGIPPLDPGVDRVKSLASGNRQWLPLAFW